MVNRNKTWPQRRAAPLEKLINTFRVVGRQINRNKTCAPRRAVPLKKLINTFRIVGACRQDNQVGVAWKGRGVHQQVRRRLSSIHVIKCD